MDNFHSIALRASPISALQSSLRCAPKSFSPSPAWFFSSSSNSSSRSSASTWPTRNAGSRSGGRGLGEREGGLAGDYGSTGENPLLSCREVRHRQIAQCMKKAASGKEGWNIKVSGQSRSDMILVGEKDGSFELLLLQSCMQAGKEAQMLTFIAGQLPTTTAHPQLFLQHHLTLAIGKSQDWSIVGQSAAQAAQTGSAVLVAAGFQVKSLRSRPGPQPRGGCHGGSGCGTKGAGLLQEERLHVRVLDGEVNSLEERNDDGERHVGMSLSLPKRTSLHGTCSFSCWRFSCSRDPKTAIGGHPILRILLFLHTIREDSYGQRQVGRFTTSHHQSLYTFSRERYRLQDRQSTVLRIINADSLNSAVIFLKPCGIDRDLALNCSWEVQVHKPHPVPRAVVLCRYI
ncbi:hypothetical protein KC341_g50 [Hortaea werneckii]|nr:hypothetical protein KC341_g50 [Hortaea werneckii]